MLIYLLLFTILFLFENFFHRKELCKPLFLFEDEIDDNDSYLVSLKIKSLDTLCIIHFIKESGLCFCDVTNRHIFISFNYLKSENLLNLINHEVGHILNFKREKFMKILNNVFIMYSLFVFFLMNSIGLFL